MLNCADNYFDKEKGFVRIFRTGTFQKDYVIGKKQLMTILTKCHRHYLFVEGEIGIGNRIPEECTIHDNYFRPPAGRALTFLRQEK